MPRGPPDRHFLSPLISLHETTTVVPLPWEVVPSPWPLLLLLTHTSKLHFSNQIDIRTLTIHRFSLQVFAMWAAHPGLKRAKLEREQCDVMVM